MSRRRPPPPPDEDEPVLVDPLEEELLEELDEELVEYFVDVEEVDSCRTSVPKSVQSSQTSSSAPSTLTVFGEDVSAPHISHWTIPPLPPHGA
jgi:hypothetical protein